MGSSPGPLPAADLTGRLRARFGQDLLESADALDQAVVRVTPERYVELIRTLRDDADYDCDFLDFVSAVDRGDDGLEVVVQLWSTVRRHQVRVKVAAGTDEPRLPSISEIYPGANWHERETWELFGIDFEGHPQLVKLLLPEQFEGHPLRKDFALTTRMAKPWPGEETTGEAPE